MTEQSRSAAAYATRVEKSIQELQQQIEESEELLRKASINSVTRGIGPV